MTTDHLQIKETTIWDQKEKARLDYELHKRAAETFSRKPDYPLYIWVAGSVLALLFNVLISIIVVKGLWSDGYNPVNHLMCLSTFVMTIMGIALIYTYIVKEK